MRFELVPLARELPFSVEGLERIANRGVIQPRTRIVPSFPGSFSTTAPYDNDEEEGAPLVAKRRRSKRSPDCLSATALAAAVCLWISVLVLLVGGYWLVSSSITSAQSAAQPYIAVALNHSLSILSHIDDSTIGANDVVNSARAVTSAAVPALESALNRSATMVARLETLLHNPTIRLSMGEGLVGR
jgi:hypothetical protein